MLADLDRFALPSPALRRLVQVFCQYRYLNDGAVVANSVGLPTGSFFQLVFENLAFIELDRQLEAIPDALHVRFGDDMLFLARDRATRDSAAAHLARYAEARGLTLKASKSVDFVLTPTHAIAEARADGARAVVAHLGVQVQPGGTARLGRTKHRRITTFLREQLQAALNVASFGALSPSDRLDILMTCIRRLFLVPELERINPAAALLTSVTDEAQLTALDRWVAITVLRLAYGDGHTRAQFRRCSFRALRARGLPSLLHLRRRRGLR